MSNVYLSLSCLLLLKGLTTTVRPEDQRSRDAEEEEDNFQDVAAVWEGAAKLEEVVAFLLVALALLILIT